MESFVRGEPRSRGGGRKRPRQSSGAPRQVGGRAFGVPPRRRTRAALRPRFRARCGIGAPRLPRETRLPYRRAGRRFASGCHDDHVPRRLAQPPRLPVAGRRRAAHRGAAARHGCPSTRGAAHLAPTLARRERPRAHVPRRHPRHDAAHLAARRRAGTRPRLGPQRRRGAAHHARPVERRARRGNPLAQRRARSHRTHGRGAGAVRHRMAGRRRPPRNHPEPAARMAAVRAFRGRLGPRRLAHVVVAARHFCRARLHASRLPHLGNGGRSAGARRARAFLPRARRPATLVARHARARGRAARRAGRTPPRSRRGVEMGDGGVFPFRDRPLPLVANPTGDLPATGTRRRPGNGFLRQGFGDGGQDGRIIRGARSRGQRARSSSRPASTRPLRCQSRRIPAFVGRLLFRPTGAQPKPRLRSEGAHPDRPRRARVGLAHSALRLERPGVRVAAVPRAARAGVRRAPAHRPPHRLHRRAARAASRYPPHGGQDPRNRLPRRARPDPRRLARTSTVPRCAPAAIPARTPPRKARPHAEHCRHPVRLARHHRTQNGDGSGNPHRIVRGCAAARTPSRVVACVGRCGWQARCSAATRR